MKILSAGISFSTTLIHIPSLGAGEKGTDLNLCSWIRIHLHFFLDILRLIGVFKIYFHELYFWGSCFKLVDQYLGTVKKCIKSVFLVLQRSHIHLLIGFYSPFFLSLRPMIQKLCTIRPQCVSVTNLYFKPRPRNTKGALWYMQNRGNALNGWVRLAFNLHFKSIYY